MFVLLSLSFYKVTFYAIFVPIIITWALYSPIALTNGAPTYQHVISLFATNFAEAREFFSTIPEKNYLSMPWLFMLTSGFWWLRKKTYISLEQKQAILIISLIILIVKAPIFSLYQSSFQAYVKVRQDTQRIFDLTNKNSWGKTWVDESAYDDYVLIIGESARKDYHHAYGYPIENTPFMSSANGMLVDGLVSAGNYTIGSLRLMLTKPDTKNWEPNYDLNLVDLANSAGFVTYWFSNNSFGGSGAYPITAIGIKSQHYHFLKNPGQASDFELLPYWKKALNKPTTDRRFFVLDIYGSHPDFCKRISDFRLLVPEEQSTSRYLNCYVSSIAKTDAFIKRVYETMVENKTKTQRSFSIIYFADHGFCGRDGRFLSAGRCKDMAQYAVPLFKVSSDDVKREEVKSFKSGLNFLEGLANWMKIKNLKIDPHYSLFDAKSDKSDYGLVKNILNGKSNPDPYVDYRK